MLKEAKEILIKKEDEGFILEWIYDKPLEVENDFGEEQVIYKSSTRCEDVYDIISTIIDPFDIDFKKLELTSLRMHLPFDDTDYELITDYAKHKNLSVRQVRLQIKEGSLDSIKINRFTLVKNKELER
jgi:hypothetical protein